MGRSGTAAAQTLRWTGAALELLDQRKLPDQTVYVTCTTAEAVASAIRDMVVRGAPAIGCAAAFGIALASLQGRDLSAASVCLAGSRPTAVNLFWALERMRNASDPLNEAIAIYEEDIRSNRRMGELGASLVPDGARILTHCNAGALATAGHGTALGVVRSARDTGKQISVIATETRPFLQGARLTAWEMMEENIPVTLVTEGMVGHLLQHMEIDLVVVGADRIAANGDVANKIGTYMLAVLAHRHRVPFYVVAPLTTVDWATPSGDDIPIEERDPSEVTGFRDLRWAPTGVKARHPAFDVTPHELVSAWISDAGIVTRPNSRRMKQLRAHDGKPD